MRGSPMNLTNPMNNEALKHLLSPTGGEDQGEGAT